MNVSEGPVWGPVWEPSASEREQTRLWQFLMDLRARGVTPADVEDSHALQRWSVTEPVRFWAEIWRAADIMADGPGPADAPWTSVLQGGEVMRPPHVVDGTWEGPRWFTDTRLNFAEHLLRRRDDGTALVAWNEHGAQRRISYAELRVLVAQCAAALRAAGVGVGDRVAGWLPNLPEAVVVMLATASLGAIWSSW